MKNAVLIGYHGHSNLGDDLFLKISCNWIERAFGADRCYVQARSGSIPPFESRVRLIPIQRRTGRVTRLEWIRIFFLALTSRVMLFSAGSIFSVQPFSLIYLVLNLLKIIRGTDLYVMALGVSIGPFACASDRIWFDRMAKKMDLLILREPWSELAEESDDPRRNVIVSYDLVLGWCAEHQKCIAPRKQDDLIGLVLTERAFCGAAGSPNEDWNTLLNVVKNYIELHPTTGTRIIVVCSDKNDGDCALSESFATAIRTFTNNVDFYSYDGRDIAGCIQAIAECRAVVTARMHAGVIGMLCAVPTYQISYSSKIRNFFSHTGIDAQYLCDDGTLSSEALMDFLSTGMAGSLAEHSAMQRRLLLERGEEVNQLLDNLIRQNVTNKK